MRLRVFALLALAATACLPNDSTDVDVPDPVALESQVWASGLGISLGSFTRLGSGVYYVDTQVGTGATLTGSPTIRFFYTGYLANGTRFDTNVGAASPAQYGLGDLIPGWTSGLQGMRVGGKRRLLIPSALGYGPSGQGSIPPNANLVFDIELVTIL